MVEQEIRNVIKSYNSAVRTWADVFASWSKPPIDFPGAFSAIDMNCWSKPFQRHLMDWRKQNQACLKIMMGVCFPHENKRKKPLNGEHTIQMLDPSKKQELPN